MHILTWDKTQKLKNPCMSLPRTGPVSVDGTMAFREPLPRDNLYFIRRNKLFIPGKSAEMRLYMWQFPIVFEPNGILFGLTKSIEMW